MATKKNLDKVEPARVAVLERALLILGAFEKQSGPLTLARLADLTGLYKSTILRLLLSLEGHGYVLRQADGQYVVGPTLFRLGTIYEKSQSARDLIMATLEQLVAKGTESASFHVRDKQQRLCLYRVNSKHTTLDTVKAGDHLPLDRGAAGRVLLAHDGAQGNQAEKVLQTGITLSKGERDAACWALAAPVFGRDGVLLGAISLSGPKERFTKASIALMSGLLQEAAKGCSAKAVSLNAVQLSPGG